MLVEMYFAKPFFLACGVRKGTKRLKQQELVCGCIGIRGQMAPVVAVCVWMAHEGLQTVQAQFAWPFSLFLAGLLPFKYGSWNGMALRVGSLFSDSAVLLKVLLAECFLEVSFGLHQGLELALGLSVKFSSNP